MDTQLSTAAWIRFACLLSFFLAGMYLVHAVHNKANAPPAPQLNLREWTELTTEFGPNNARYVEEPAAPAKPKDASRHPAYSMPQTASK